MTARLSSAQLREGKGIEGKKASRKIYCTVPVCFHIILHLACKVKHGKLCQAEMLKYVLFCCCCCCCYCFLSLFIILLLILMLLLLMLLFLLQLFLFVVAVAVAFVAVIVVGVTAAAAVAAPTATACCYCLILLLNRYCVCTRYSTKQCIYYFTYKYNFLLIFLMYE